MCTAISFKTDNHYFGRTLDLEISYKEEVVITPRAFRFNFRKLEPLTEHYAIIGMATVFDDYPLYYEATNEKGLSMAGLNFPGNADYKPYCDDKDNVAPFEFIPWILGQCADISQAKALLERINLVNINFNDELPLSPLHWIISDKERSLTVESVKDGLKIYDNPIGVLTNNPPFDYQMMNLNNYISLTKEIPENRFCDKADLTTYSRGMGALGLPGDVSSVSRFVRATFVKLNSLCGNDEEESVSQFFHILGSVEQQRGCVRLGENLYELTIYTSCCNTDKGIYYYTTYNNQQITAVNMNNENLNSDRLIAYPLITNQQIFNQN
ncbi:MAG: choloylglycine hydrolase [Eubacterium sp.]